MDKRYEHSISEPAAQQKWESEQTYSAQNNPGQTYTIDTPPPGVSGSLHLGHIFSYTQTDIVARYKRMNGFSVFYPFGFDDNGLPTEKYVEKKRKISAHAVGRSEFIKICLTETHEAEQQFKTLWQRMGLSADWNICYSTISDEVRKLSQESFISLYKKNFIYRKFEPALYCTTCRTSVAQAELDDTKQDSFFNDIVFQDKNGRDLIIGTTRPELLPSCVALLYNPDDERYQHLKDSHVTVPIFNFKVPVYASTEVSIEKGTGLVMCCTFGDKTDIIWFKQFNLPYKQSIGFDGKFTNDSGPLAGLNVKDARAKIIELLREQNLLLKQEVISHSVNVHERCKKEIEYIALEQWFINILDYKKTFLDLADQINWYPEFMKTRYRDWVEHLGWDWCISRQRYYGIPFPAYHCKDCHAILLADIKDLPIDPQEKKLFDTCPTCSGSNIIADSDVMDTWNTSSITPYILAQLANPTHSINSEENIFSDTVPDFLPMSMRPQAHDIIRTWAFDTIVKTWMHHKIIPWRDIVISGHALSGSNEKLSKSKENSKLTPEGLLATYPADVIRYWTASGKLGYDIAFSENQLKIGQRLVTKLWNAFRFIHEHISPIAHHTPSPAHPAKPGVALERRGEFIEGGIINEWALHQISRAFEQYKTAFEQYEFGSALNHIEPFFWNDFCDNYLELIKNQLFNPDSYTPEQVAATRWTLHEVGLRILQLYAPYLPHLTETLYASLYQATVKKPSIHQTQFADIQIDYIFEESARKTTSLIALASTIRKLKTEQQLSLKTPVAQLVIHLEDLNLQEALQKEQQTIAGVTQAQTVIFKQSPVKTNKLEEIDTLWHAEVSV